MGVGMGRPRLSRDQRRRQIIASAIDTFSARGFHGTRMEDVAHAAGVNIALVYQHFPHKEDLFDAILDALYADNPMVAHFADLTQGTDDEAVFRYVIESYATLNERDIAIQRLLLFAALERPALYRRQYKELESVVVRMLTDYIQKRVDDGTFRPLDAGLTARLCAAQASVYMTESRVLDSPRWDGYSLDAVLTVMVMTFLDGLKRRLS